MCVGRNLEPQLPRDRRGIFIAIGAAERTRPYRVRRDDLHAGEDLGGGDLRALVGVLTGFVWTEIDPVGFKDGSLCLPWPCRKKCEKDQKEQNSK